MKLVASCLAVLAAAAAVAEEYRPQLHFTPEKNWMNDPNGMFYDASSGLYHLYFQCNPFANQWGHMSWGHATSRDRLTWTEQPLAIPQQGATMIFSGSALIHGDQVLAFYTAAHSSGTQSQALAISQDRGYTFAQYALNPLIDIGSSNFRDPKVQFLPSLQTYVMAVVRSDIHQVEFYAAAEPTQWSAQPVGRFGPAGAVGGVWECPDLFELPVLNEHSSKWVLVVNINPGGPNGGSAMQYFVGDFDGEQFESQEEPGDGLWLDYGHDFYAAVTWNGDAHKGDRVMLGWSNNWMYAADIPTSPWKGAMSLPRKLTLVHTR